MAFDATKAAFEARITNNEFNELCNVAGKYADANDEFAFCPAGRLVFPGGSASLLDAEGFTGIKNENTFYFTDAPAETTRPVYACNTYDVQLISNGTEAYAVGTKTLGLGVPANRYGNFTIIIGDGQHVYRFGEGNISDGSTPSSEDILVMDGTGGLEAAQDAPTAGSGQLYFVVRGTGTFTEGTTASFGYIDLEARRA